MLKYVNRRTVAIFMLVFLCLSFVAGGGITAAYLRSVERETNEYLNRLESETDRVFDYLEQSLTAGINAGNSIFASTWYEHYQNIIGVYDSEFTWLRRIEIKEDLQGTVSSLPLVADIMVIAPRQNHVICKEGWFTLPMYRQVYDTITIDLSAGLTQQPDITINDDNYCALVLYDTTARKYKSVICLMISKKTFVTAANHMLGAFATGFSAALDGRPLTEACEPECDSDEISISRSDDLTKLTMSVRYLNYDAAVGQANQWMYVGMMMIMLAAAVFLSVVITMALVQPINRMILQFGGETKDLENPYRFIYEYVDAFAKNHARLSKENDTLRNSRKRFLSLMRNEIILGMLTNPDFNFSGDYIHSAFPWIAEGKPFLLVVCQDKRFSDKQLMRKAEDYCVSCENSSYASMDQESWFILWFENEERLEAGKEELKENLRNMLFVISGKMEDTALISKAYLRMKEELEAQRSRWRELPMVIQTRLVSRIYANRHEEVYQLITDACGSHSPEAVLWLLIRIASDACFDISDYAEQYHELEATENTEEQISLLAECAQALCRFVAVDRQQVNGAAAAEICRYIENHFEDPELSVNQLADRFAMHRTLISKAVKAETGETFTEYLLKLRMERATELLRSTEESIAVIAERVGVLNYATFKRSFSKVYNCTPKEWREKHQD